MKNSFVSVVMPVYNTPEKELRQAIESILNQTYKEFEFIIIDDASTNNCLNIIKSYDTDKIVILQNKENLGIEKTLNKGIRKSKGKYIVRMDSDDISYPNRLEIQIKFLEEHPEYSFIGGRADFFNENGIFRESKFAGEVKKQDFLLGTPFIHPTMVFKKEILEKVGGYPISNRTEDYLLQMQLYSKGYRGYIISEKVLKYRQNNKTIKRFSVEQRINEVKVKIKGFKMLKIKWYQYVYILKPIIAIFIPRCIIKLYQKNKK